MFKKKAETSVKVSEFIMDRWSGVAFDSQRQIGKEDLLAMLEAARWAPSCYGDQPWRFVVWDRDQDQGHWQRAYDCLAEGNQSWVKNAPILLLVTANTEFRHNGKHNRWAQYDTGAASISLCLEAASRNIMTHQMGGFDAEKIRSEFLIPEQYDCMAMIAAGYQLAEVEIPESIKTREYNERQRKELDEIYSSGEW